MNYQKLKALFPEIVLDKKDDQDNYLEFKVNNTWFSIPKGALTKREQEIIELFNEGSSVKKTTSAWQNFLYRNGDKPASAEQLRFLHFNVNNLISTSKRKWQELILSFFGAETHHFWNDTKEFIIIDEKCKLTEEDFSGILTTIDSDFSTKTQLLIGSIWNKNDDLNSLYDEEELIFNEIDKNNDVVTVPECALEFFTKFSSHKSSILKTFNQKFKEYPDLKQLVINLYQVGGNVSQAAKKMYIHRNTIEYRIDKLRQDFQLNLHKMDDLIFCYLVFV